MSEYLCRLVSGIRVVAVHTGDTCFMPFQLGDIILAGIMLLSGLLALMRGFTREVLSLIAWVVAFWVAYQFCIPASSLLEGHISTPTVRYVVAFVALLVLSLLVTGLINFFISKLIDKTGLSGTDRMLGVLFGVIRGVAIVGVIVFLAGLTPVPQDPWWLESMLIDHFQELALIMISYLPPDWANHFSYS